MGAVPVPAITRGAMDLEIREEPIGSLAGHAQLPIAFVVDTVLAVLVPNGGLGGIVLEERAVEAPYLKDYDAIKGEGPTRWSKRFDVTNWGLIAAFDDGARIGGAVVAFQTPDLDLLGGRGDVAVLWDLRVLTERRRAGVGSALFRAVEDWARERACTEVRVETQNVNVAACHFYARLGCTLASVDRFAYEDLPDETRLLWRREL